MILAHCAMFVELKAYNVKHDGQNSQKFFSYFSLTEPRERPTHHSQHAGIAAPSRKDNATIRDKERLRVNAEGLGTHREFDDRHHDYGAVRDKDWGSGDFERAGRSHKPRHDREKHVRGNSRPVNRHEPRGGL